MKLIIAGSRTLDIRWNFIMDYIRIAQMNTITEIVSGACPTGIDRAGERFAEEYQLILTRFPAKWDEEGKSAGPKRNRKMAHYADALLLIWDGESRGSSNMKNEMLKLDKPVYEIIIKKHNI